MRTETESALPAIVSSPIRSAVAAAELDRIDRQRLADLIDQNLERRHGLQRAIAAHRAGGDAARMLGDGGHVDLGDVVDADRPGRADNRDARRVVGEAAAVEDVIGGEGRDAAARAVDADLRPHLEGVPLDAALELLEAVMGEAHRASRQEHRRQRDIEHEGRVVLAAEAAADIGELGIDGGRLVGRIGLAEQIGDGLGRLERRLHAEHQFEAALARRTRQARIRAPGTPGRSTASRNRARASAPRDRPPRVRRGSPRRTRRPSCIEPVLGHRQRPPERPARAFDEAGADPALEDRRIDIEASRASARRRG